MALTDTGIKAAKPTAKPVKMTDGDGLYLLIQPTGGKWWRFDYRSEEKRKTLSMGTYPQVGLKDARTRRDDARKLIANGINPGEHREANKNARADPVGNSFENIARKWLTKLLPTWTPGHADKILRRLECDVFPWIGGKPISDLNAPDVWRQSAASRPVAAWRPPTAPFRTAARSSAMPWRPAAPTAILPATFGAPYIRQGKHTWPLSPIRWKWAPSSGRSTPSAAP